MPKVAVRQHGKDQYVWYYCPGCKQLHGVPSERWHWNGDVESPTLTPSVRHYIPAVEGRVEKTTCHYHVVAGKIEFCADCEHELKGQKVELQEPMNVPDNS
jgi:ribosomal protein L34E